MAPPRTYGPRTLQRRLLQAAADGDLHAFKRIATALDGGKGRIGEAVEAVRDRGTGALHVAASRGRMLLCAYMVEDLQMDINAADESGNVPLSHAVRAGNVDTVRYLLDHGADPDKPVGFGCTSIHIAVAEGSKVRNSRTVTLKGADVNFFSEIGTPLHVAAMENQDAAMKILLDHGTDCNNECFALLTPLLTALKARSLNCVKLLIKAGADVTKGVGKATPLIFAASEGLTDFYEYLLEAGADPDATSDDGFRPIEIAALANRRKDVEILLPVTSRIPSVHDWSVDGILTYVKSIPTDKDDPVYKMKPTDLKLEGGKAYKREDYFNAAKFYSVAIESDPQSCDATLFSNRSLCYIKMGEGHKALIDAGACRIILPYWPKAWYRQGAAHMLLKDYGKSCDAFLDGLKLDPSNVEMENALREALNSLKISRAGNMAP
ncbi:unnamed protein product [Urochloa decumbens]|uniref:Uncharacterized protein n=1 Tax=Urochloa decumbens TaxID=240449 RepID=A0ABC8VCI4_9POAL